MKKYLLAACLTFGLASNVSFAGDQPPSKGKYMIGKYNRDLLPPGNYQDSCIINKLVVEDNSFEMSGACEDIDRIYHQFKNKSFAISSWGKGLENINSNLQAK